MEQFILVVHVLTAVAIIGLILLQQGKGAEMGASFGAGASQTVFGSQGSGNFFTRSTAVLATLFFATSFGLAVVAKQNADVAAGAGIPVLQESREEAPAVPDSDLPLVDPDQTQEDTTGDLPVVDEEPEPSELPQ
ncbi:preprotein translocase subunit SecG [Exilibacterium tricleocarpae]|uniref:Protein-export membrane protein SecG n=1 Tax=Exilibacterium tricleocarpae TaxID=2591008 RepID=A0A545TBB8_9GAMM|nr:preprotein translocase subunit SecG [Exilibacterium tricleocarpae]TQV74509.1 preprotein translocase subunit SecG [Exilibacterium tricleocarpae]